MKNKVELKKTIFYCIIVICLFVVVFIIANYYQYKRYTYNYNLKISQLISEIKKQNPDEDITELVKILNTNTNIQEKPLKEYGIDLLKDSTVLENDEYYKEVLIKNTFLVIIFSLTILIIFLRYNKKKDNTLNQILKYLEEINRKNYKLDIEENSEDELSILKNEIYKTTVMLKEVAENSKNDKLNLKNSLSDISHQLKTPLTSINIMLDNLLENADMDINMRKEFIADIKREIINISFLISVLLKLSRLDANSVTFINQEVKIKDIVDESVKNVSALSDLNKVEINITGNDTDTIICDAKWQIEAITNILKNCVEHSKENSSINISYEKGKVYSKITIEDNGGGISEKDLPHIFERFYKGENSTSDSVGIGLALAKSIVENCNGYIKVESKINEGTKFTIILEDL